MAEDTRPLALPYRHFREGVLLPCAADELISDVERFSIRSDACAAYLGLMTEAFQHERQQVAALTAERDEARRQADCPMIQCPYEADLAALREAAQKVVDTADLFEASHAAFIALENLAALVRPTPGGETP